LAGERRGKTILGLFTRAQRRESGGQLGAEDFVGPTTCDRRQQRLAGGKGSGTACSELDGDSQGLCSERGTGHDLV
jgi:hypothetical protein